MKEEEIEKGDRGTPIRNDFLSEILSNLNQAVPYHLEDERLKCVSRCIRLTCLTLVCAVFRYRLIQVRQNLKRRWFERLFSTCNRHLAVKPGG